MNIEQAISVLRAGPNWVWCSDYLPTATGKCLVTDGDQVAMAMFYVTIGRPVFQPDAGSPKLDEIVAWQPVPRPPVKHTDPKTVSTSKPTT